MKDYQALRHYIQYIPKRINMIKNFPSSGSVMEVKYYTELYKKIHEFGKSHVLFFKFITGKMTMKRILPIFGCSERTIYRIMKKQKDDLIKIIQESEKVLKEKYPFVEFEYIFDGEVE